MVSLRCKMVVKDEIKKLGLHYTAIELGMVDILEDITNGQREQFRKNLLRSGLELLEDKKIILIERIKNVVVEMFHLDYDSEMPNVNFSDYLSEKLGYDYTYLSNVFSEVQGINIQQFLIMHKIEKVKEMLLYGELTLSEIAYQLCYSSVAHLSNQFKKVTGLSPSFYRKLRQKQRARLEEA